MSSPMSVTTYSVHELQLQDVDNWYPAFRMILWYTVYFYVHYCWNYEMVCSYLINLLIVFKNTDVCLIHFKYQTPGKDNVVHKIIRDIYK